MTPPASMPDNVISLWPGDNSEFEAQPGTGNVFVLTLDKDLDPTHPFDSQLGVYGSWGLVWESEALGYQQVETIAFPGDGAAKITKVGNRKVEIRFSTALLEDETYHITISDKAIRFADGSWFDGISFYDLENFPPADPQWNFQVDDITPPEMVDCDDPNNVNGDFGVSIDLNPVVICFDEPVQWVSGKNPYEIGNIAFYLAAKADLDPNTEFGGDVLYASPLYVSYYYNNVLVVEKSASISEMPSQFDKVEIYLKDVDYDALKTKSAAIGNHVWPVDRDIYLRFAPGLLQDLAKNAFAGIDGSPFDPYSVNGQQYWFSTREEGEIGSIAWANEETTTEPSGLPGTARTGLLWQNDDIRVKIFSNNLEFVTGAAITTANVNQFIKLSIDGVNVPYTVNDTNEGDDASCFLLDPGTLPEFKTLKVELLGNIIRDNGDLRVVPADSWTFTTGDFSAPGIAGTINNLLCTNFDLRVTTSKNSDNSLETGVVYYALVKDTLPMAGWPAFPTDITAAEIVKGQVKRTIGTYPNKYDYYWHFYHVADGVLLYGKTGIDTKLQWQSATVPPAGTPPVVTSWQKDSFNISSSMIAFEHIDDFTAENHGDNYNIYYFAVDKVSQGPYNNPVGAIIGRTTAVTMKDVQLTDCLEPELTWYYEDIIDDDIDWTYCTETVNPRIQKDGKFALYFADSLQTEGIQLVESNLDWTDVVTLEVREYNGGTWNSDNPWTNAEIESIVPIIEGGKTVGIIVTPLNNYPSQGRARVILASGSVEDAAGNAINEELVCRKNVEIYNDPWVDVFTVETEDLLFPNQFPALNGVAAQKDGKITIQFNNPVFTPKRDESDAPNLEPLSLDPDTLNYVGNYIKLREGDENGAEVEGGDVIEDAFTFELYGYDAEGELVLLAAPITQGIVKIVATPKAYYKSETWYYVELEKELQDENRRELSYVNNLGTWDNNLFVDVHEQYTPYPVAPLAGNPTTWGPTIGNMANYFMRFKAEDSVSPELRFVFEKFAPENYPDGPSVVPYIEEVDSASVFCTDPLGGFGDNTIPVGAIITEWSKMGFDNKDYYIEQDPNGLRPYFKMKNASGNEIPFDVVVLNIYEPVDEVPSYTNDAVWFGFVPFVPLAEGASYTMEFNPNYQAPQSGQAGIPVGPVFVDDSGNPLVANTLVTFTTCSVGPLCFSEEISTPTTVFDGKKVAGSITPTFTITTEEPAALNGGVFSLTEVNPSNNAPVGPTYYAGSGVPSPGISSSGNVITINFSAFGVSGLTALGDNKKYLVTTPVGGTIGVTGYPSNFLLGCGDTMYFWSPDLTAPGVLALSPDIDRLAILSDVDNNLGQDATDIDPRNPGELRIQWNEKVVPQAGKVIEVWENGTTLRAFASFTYPSSSMTWDAATNTMKIKLPADQMNYYKPAPNATGHFHVDVKAGFVKDVQGNASASLTGDKDRLTTPTGDGTLTWTFQTGTNEAPEIVDWSPKCLVEPGEMSTEPVDADNVKINKISVTLTEGALPVTGKKLYLRRAVGGTDVYVTNVTAMTASADKKTYSITPANLVVDNNEEFRIFVEEGAFKENYPLSSVLATPNYENENFLNCEDSGFDQYVQIPASFAFGEKSAPTATIWPVNGNVKVPFNAHGYVKFSEKLIARAGFTPGDPQLVLTQSNIKNWIKVTKETSPGSGTYVALTPAEYVVEFVNLERTRMRVTFLDEQAPAIDGVTANMMDEWNYRINVNTNANIGGIDYLLQDYSGNFLGMPAGESSGNWYASALLETEQSTFTTEDITVPNFYATTCDVTHNTIEIKFTPWVNEDPYGNGRDYPAETGKVYYVVRPDGATVTAADLYNKVWSDVQEVVIATADLAAGKTVTWTAAGNINLASGYNYKVYAVMQDDETDVFVSTAYGSAWPVSDDVFVESGDTDPASGAIGLADIRVAPNKNQTVRSWEFCYCDNDDPQVVSKEWNQNVNVPVDETFTITFDEMIQFGALVEVGGDGTGGIITAPKYGYEVRLREWNNNVAVPIELTMNPDSSFTIDPTVELQEETRYYIEIDRWVVNDVPGSNCEGYQNVLPEGFPLSQCTACSETPNNFNGWIGRSEWWFQTTDNTPPVLTDVSPLGECVSVNNNKVVFTFEEKNEMLVANLTGQANNVYIYKVGSTVPYEIVSAHSAVPVRVSGNTWTITYTTTHPYNSEEEYYVLWNKALFVDNAIPVKHPYTEGLAEVVDYELNSSYQKFGFTTEDATLPVVDWAFVNRMWESEFGDEYIYSLADGSFNRNDLNASTVDVCEMYEQYGGVPTTVGMYVWFNEPVELTDVAAGDNYWDRFINANFYLTSASGNVSLKYEDHGVAGEDMEIPGDVEVPEGAQWFYVSPLNDLASLGNYDFGVKANVISDMLEEGEDEDCRVNELPMINLFDFCTWDETPPTAELFDGKDHRIEVLNDSIDHCIAEREYLVLKFSKPVVKTINVTVPPQFGNPGNPWWSFSNLFLTEADLKDTDGQIFRFWNETTDEYVVVSDVDIVTPGVEYKLWLDEPMASENVYEFEIYADKLKDMVRIPNGNFYPGEVWDWYVTDWDAPYITSTTPADEQQNVSPVADLKVVFNEPVVLGTDARIIIRDNGQAQGVVYNFRADDSEHITLLNDDMTVVINHDGLDKNTAYYVQIEAGFVYEENCSNLAFDGKSEQGSIKDSWNFTTGDVDGPVASLWPVPGDACVEIDANLVMRFDENIELTDKGQVVIYKARDGQWHNPTWPDAMFGDVVAVIPFTDANYPQVRISGSDAANGLTRDIITVTPPAGLWESDATYYVRVTGNGHTEGTEADVVVDAVGNSWMYPVSHESLVLLPGIHHNQWYFKIGNNDEPVLIGMTPERGEVVEAGVASAVTDLTMTFDDEIAFGSGKIQVYEFIVNPEGGVAAQEANLWKEYDVPADVLSGKIELSGNTVTVKDVNLLDGINWYYVVVTPGTITNNVECTLRGWSGISNPDVWLFSTEPDVTEPDMMENAVTSEACSDTYLEPATIQFELTFSEGVSVANGTGLVEIAEVGGDVVATAVITPAMIEDGVVTLSVSDFDNALEDQTAYELVIGGEAIHDLATASLAGTQNPFGRVPFGNENWFAGVTIPFATGDFTAPTAIAFTPTAVDLENDVTLTVTFDEAVQDGGLGMLNLYDAEADTLIASFDAANDEDDDATTVTFTTTLPDETSYYVLIEEGFVSDMVYMESCDTVRGNNAVTDEAAWTFAIDDNTVPAITADLTEDTDNLMMSFDIVLQYNDVITAVDASKAHLMLEGYAANGVTGAEIGEDPTQVIVSVTVENDQKEYMLHLAEGFVLDDAINPNANLAEETGPYMVGDRTDPILEDAAPEGILGSYIGVEVMVDFFDDSELTVVEPITIENSLGEVVETWMPELDSATQSASFMPELWFGTYTVIIPAGAVVDVNGNEFAGASWSFAIIDNIAPQDSCLTIISPVDGADCVGTDIMLEMEFCERMAAGDETKLVKVYNILEIGGGLSENVLFTSFPVTEDMVDGTMVSIPLSGLADNTGYTVMMDAGALTDEAGNDFVGINDPIRWNFTTGDNTAPEVKLIPEGSDNNVNDIVVIAEFSEEVIGAVDAIIVENAVSYVVEPTTNPLEYKITINAADMDTVTVTVPFTITDVACNFNALAEEVTETYVVGDNTAPTVTVTDAPADAMNTENTFTVELTFSEEVSGVVEALAGSVGLDTVVTTDNIVYTLTFAGDDETEGKLLLDNTLVADVSVNENQLAEGIDWAFKVGDHVAPTATVEPEEGDDLREDALEITVTFSEDVVVPEGGIVVTGGVATVTNVGNVYSVVVTAEDGAEVVLGLTSLITDDSENANELAAAEYTYTFGDRTAPEVIVYRPGATDTIPTFDVTISFTEKVTGVDTESVTLTGDGAEITLRTIVEGWAYEATITGAEGSTLVLGFSDAIEDLAGNALVPVDFTYTIGDFTAPTTVSVSPEGDQGDDTTFPLVLTLSEDVSAGTGALTVYNADGSVFKAYDVSEAVIEGNKVTIDGSFDKYSKYFVLVDAGFVKDLAGNNYAGISNMNEWKFETKNFATGIENLANTFKVYPNPFNDHITIDNNDKLTRVVVVNIAGQRVIDIEYPNREIRTANLVSGVYVISLYTEDGIAKSERIIKR